MDTGVSTTGVTNGLAFVHERVGVCDATVFYADDVSKENGDCGGSELDRSHGENSQSFFVLDKG